MLCACKLFILAVLVRAKPCLSYQMHALDRIYKYNSLLVCIQTTVGYHIHDFDIESRFDIDHAFCMLIPEVVLLPCSIEPQCQV